MFMGSRLHLEVSYFANSKLGFPILCPSLIVTIHNNSSGGNNFVKSIFAWSKWEMRDTLYWYTLIQFHAGTFHWKNYDFQVTKRVS